MLSCVEVVRDIKLYVLWSDSKGAEYFRGPRGYARAYAFLVIA